jgi:hypothetical protein
MDGALYLADVLGRLGEARATCEAALAQVPRERWTLRLDPEANSLATLMAHLSGNMLSRWTDFLTSDGEKADRNRDAEFEDPADPAPEALLERWERGWTCLLGAVGALAPSDLERTVLIRSRPHTVVQALNRQLAHYAYHTGQLVFLAKHLSGATWHSLSVPRHGSAAFNAALGQEV